MVSECIEWAGSRNRTNGYGKGYICFAGARFVVSAHRFVYEQERGPIPAGAVVMHLCDNPGCVNIDHLSLGSQADNLADMVAKGRHWAASKTHCKRGHEFTEANTYRRPGHVNRYCNECRRIRKGVRRDG